MLEDDEAGNDSVRDAAIDMCAALNAQWPKGTSSPLEVTKGRAAKPVAAFSFLIEPYEVI